MKVDAIVRNRMPVGGIDVTVAALVALDCLVINALVVHSVPTLTVDSLGPIAVAYHDKAPGPLAVAVVVVILLLGSLLRGIGRIATLVFVGGALANFASPTIWGAVPDYIVFRKVDMVVNLADILIVAAGTLVVAVLVARLICARLGR